MDVMVEIKIWRWRGGRHWRWSKTFPFLVRKNFNVLVHKTYQAVDQRQRVHFGGGGIPAQEGQFRLLGYDFKPRIIGKDERRPDVNGNQQPL